MLPLYHVISKNVVEDNNFVGIGLLGWCTATNGTPYNCSARPPIYNGELQPPDVSRNVVAQNKVSGNGTNAPPIPIAFLAADITYFEFEGSSGNCFQKNKPAGFTFVSSQSDGLLPTDGC